MRSLAMGDRYFGTALELHKQQEGSNQAAMIFLTLLILPASG